MQIASGNQTLLDVHCGRQLMIPWVSSPDCSDATPVSLGGRSMEAAGTQLLDQCLARDLIPSWEQTDVSQIPQSLREFAAASRIPRADVDMLASIRFRGDQPESMERWEYIYRAIKLSKPMDESQQ
jgi:hypothetical protein